MNSLLQSMYLSIDFVQLRPQHFRIVIVVETIKMFGVALAKMKMMMIVLKVQVKDHRHLTITIVNIIIQVLIITLQHLDHGPHGFHQLLHQLIVRHIHRINHHGILTIHHQLIIIIQMIHMVVAVIATINNNIQ